MTKRILFLFIAFCLLPFGGAWAQTGTYIANGVTWRYKLEGTPLTATITGTNNGYTFTGALNIPAQIIHAGTTYPVTKIGASAFDSYSSATSLTIPATVITIENRAFFGCSGFTDIISLPNVTTIGESAFHYCYYITGLSLPNATTIEASAFASCYSITGNLSLPKATKIGGGAFNGCRSITGLSLPNVTTIEIYAFLYCYDLSGELNLPSSIKSIGYEAFYNCNLESVTFESGASLNALGEHVFAYCNKLRYIDMANVTLPSGTIADRTNGCFKYLQPYTMVYLPAGTTVAANQVNFVIGNTCADFRIFDRHSNYKYGVVGCDYPIQHPFTATKASYERTFSGTTCKTICLPYPATLPTGFRAYELREKLGAGTRFRFVSVAEGGDQLEANKPYLLQVTDGATTKPFDTEDHNVYVPVTPTTIEVPATADGTIFFGGTTTNIDNATAAAGGYYNLSNNGWYPIKTDNTEGHVHSFRCYIRTTGGAPAKGFSIVLDDNETTDIDSSKQAPEQSITQSKGNIYTLDGRFAGTDVNALKSGEIYVKNGKKFYKH